VPGDNLTIVRTFNNLTDGQAWRPGLLMSVDTTHNGLTSSQAYFYDQYHRLTDRSLSGTGVNGTHQTQWTYDTWGNIHTIATSGPMTSEPTLVTRYEYDEIVHHLPTKIINPQLHFIRNQYHGIDHDKGLFGQLWRTHGLSSDQHHSTIIEDREYDSFGRITNDRIDDTNGNKKKIETTYSYEVDNEFGLYKTFAETTFDSADDITTSTKTYTDSLGRIQDQFVKANTGFIGTHYK
jgi:hypothetical protein